MEHIGSPAASSCAYWRLASEGRSFYTDASDQVTCPVGGHTHGVALTDGAKRELGELVEYMIGLDYLGREEVASIPRREREFRYAAYTPLNGSTGSVDVILVRGAAKELMLLCEAARRAGVRFEGGLMGRPTCAVIPLAAGGGTATSLGCIGNRVYTELADGELYVALPGAELHRVEEKLDRILAANRELEAFHQQRVRAC